MRAIALLFALILACPASADDWKEYDSSDHAFTALFPTDPKIEATTYQTPDGRAFSARTYSSAQDSGAFTLTVAEVPETGKQTGEDTDLNDAIRKMTGGAELKFDTQHRIRWLYDRQLGIAGANGGYS